MACVVGAAWVRMQTIGMSMFGLFIANRRLVTFQTQLILLRYLRIVYLFLLKTRRRLVIGCAATVCVRRLYWLISMSSYDLRGAVLILCRLTLDMAARQRDWLFEIIK